MYFQKRRTYVANNRQKLGGEKLEIIKYGNKACLSGQISLREQGFFVLFLGLLREKILGIFFAIKHYV